MMALLALPRSRRSVAAGDVAACGSFMVFSAGKGLAVEEGSKRRRLGRRVSRNSSRAELYTVPAP